MASAIVLSSAQRPIINSYLKTEERKLEGSGEQARCQRSKDAWQPTMESVFSLRNLVGVVPEWEEGSR